MCNCDEGAVCARHRGTRHDLAYHDPQSAPASEDDPWNDHAEPPVPEQERNNEL